MKKLWKPALLLAAVAVMVIGMLGSGAWFTDGAQSDPSTIHTGTLSIDENQFKQLTFSINNLVPGGETGPVSVYIYNDGNTDLALFVDMVLGGADAGLLKNAIYIKTAKTEFLGGTDPSGKWQADENWFTGDGVSLWGPIGDGKDTYTSLAEWDGFNGNLTAPYELGSALKPGYGIRYTFTFGMLTSAGNGFQNKTMDITFKAGATQFDINAIRALAPAYTTLTWMQGQLDMQH